MAGIRVVHDTARNVRFTIVENDHPYPSGPQQCTPPEFGGCGSTHEFKTHHLNIDEAGSAIVGDVLYERIKFLLVLNGFRESNVVAQPPTLGIGIGAANPGSGAWGNIPIIRGKGDGDG
jgi:hypothetical protein